MFNIYTLHISLYDRGTLGLVPSRKQLIHCTQVAYRRGYIVENCLKIYGVPGRYVYDSKDRFFVFTGCDVQARDSRVALRQATKKASCEVNESGARNNGCRVPTLNIARNEELIWRIRAPCVAFSRGTAASPARAATRVLSIRTTSQLLSYLSSRKKVCREISPWHLQV